MSLRQFQKLNFCVYITGVLILLLATLQELFLISRRFCCPPPHDYLLIQITSCFLYRQRAEHLGIFTFFYKAMFVSGPPKHFSALKLTGKSWSWQLTIFTMNKSHTEKRSWHKTCTSRREDTEICLRILSISCSFENIRKHQ